MIWEWPDYDGANDPHPKVCVGGTDWRYAGDLYPPRLTFEHDGHRISYRQYGKCDSKKTVLFFMGLDSREVLCATEGEEGLAKAINKYADQLNLNILMIDRPCHAESVFWEYQWQDFSRMIMQLVEEMDLQNLTMIGYSLGAAFVMSCATHPDLQKRIDKLILVAPWIPYTSPGLHWLANILGNWPRLRYFGVSAYYFMPVGFQQLSSSSLSSEDMSSCDISIVSQEVFLHEVDLAFSDDFGFQPMDIPSAIDIVLCHGTEDLFCSQSTVEWLRTSLHEKVTSISITCDHQQIVKEFIMTGQVFRYA